MAKDMPRKPKKDLKMSSVDEQDERFTHLAYDPRFQRFPGRHKNKVKVDERFQRMFTDEAFRVGASKDKRGRKDKGKKDEVRRYYRLDDEGAEGAEGEEGGPGDDVEGDRGLVERAGEGLKDSSSEDDEPLDEHALRALRMRGLAGSSSSESEDDSASESDSEKSDAEADNELAEGVLDENIEELYNEWGVGAYAANPNERVLMLEDSTRRLACVDMDWENVKAVDLLAVLRSFVPDGGRVVSVTVYPSDYGLEKMEEEKAAGPRQIYRKSLNVKGKNGGEERGEGDRDGTHNEDEHEDEDEEGEDGAVDESRLRYYERSKLRWYYAIVVCSDVETAEAIYRECDGMEYMKTANMFDLRFVPDDQDFGARQVRDSASEVPDDYVAPVFQTKALQHTNVELTWDKVDGDRKKTLSRKLNADDLKDEDFKTYLASASEDEVEHDDLVPEGDADAVRKRYQSLLHTAGTDGTVQRRGNKEWGAEGESSDEGREDGDDGGKETNGISSYGCVSDKNMELQVTFEQDLETLGEKLSTKAKERKSGKGAETVWESYVRRKKEKKEEARRKGKVNYHSSDDDYEDDFDSDIEQEPVSPKKNGTKAGKSDDPFDDPFFTSNDTFKDPSDPSLRNKKKKSKRDAGVDAEDAGEEHRNRQAELEMLLMDDALTGGRGKRRAIDEALPNKKMSKKERMKLAKLKKRAEREDGSDNEDLDAANKEYLDMKDPRFQEVFENPEFALDPTDPRFAKAGKGASKLASEAARRRSRAKKTDKPIPAPKSGGDVPGASKRLDQGGGADLKLMVANLKRKQAAQPAAGKKGKNW